MKISQTPNAIQKKWMQTITEWSQDYGWMLIPDGWGGIQRHHVVGRTARQNKVPIGHWFILPLPYSHHDPQATPMHENHVERNKRGFISQYGLQNELFFKMVDHMRSVGFEIPLSEEELEAIKNSNK